MPATIDATRTTPTQVLVVIANPAVSTTLGWPVGFWGSELTHPYYAFREAGYEVTVASPEGRTLRARRLQRSPRRERLLGRGPDHDGLLLDPPALAGAR